MLKIAIILFPGLNTEYETRREIHRAGMRGEFFRWNEPASKLAGYDGYVIGGGFSYEDRGRAGVIAAQDPLMKAIKDEAAKGKPVLGICNGAQILVESGLIPGLEGNKLGMSLARNKRIKDGEVLGTGYYNTWAYMKCVVPKGRCMFTSAFEEHEVFRAPIAHGEGRFTTEILDLLQELANNDQMVFRYCDAHGAMNDEFPTNPNGAQYNLAAVCNPEGNVMAIMPHLERAEGPSQKLFTSMRMALESKSSGDHVPAGEKKKRVHRLTVKPMPTWPLATFEPQPTSTQLLVSLKITDNEAETFDLTLKNLGWDSVKLKRFSHFEVSYKGKQDAEKLAKKLTQSGIIANTNKETVKIVEKKATGKKAKVVGPEETSKDSVTLHLLIREKQDFVGLSKLSSLQKRLKMEEITGVRTGTLWELTFDTKSRNVAEDTLKKILATNLFFNPNSQDAVLA